jgi:hypothetical protein
MIHAPTDPDGLLKFLADEADTFFAHPAEPPQPGDNDNPAPQHPSRAAIAELRAGLDAPAAGDQIRSSWSTSRALLSGSILAAATVALCLAGVLVFMAGGAKIIHPKTPAAVSTPPVTATAAPSPSIAAESPGSAGTAESPSPVETTGKSYTAPAAFTAAPVDEATARAAMNRGYAAPKPGLDRARLDAAALHKMTPRPAAQSSPPPRPRPHRRPVPQPAAIAPLPDIEPGCPPSLSTACPHTDLRKDR